MTVRKTLQDSAYVAVGVAVLGAQRVQTRGRKVADHLQLLSSDAKSRIEPMITRVSEPAIEKLSQIPSAIEPAKAKLSDLPSAIEPAKAKLSELPATAVEVGSQIAELPNMMFSATERFSDAQDKLKTALNKAMAEGKARIGGTATVAGKTASAATKTAAAATKRAAAYTGTLNATSPNGNGKSAPNTNSTNN